jgi:hypothetical protein
MEDAIAARRRPESHAIHVGRTSANVVALRIAACRPRGYRVSLIVPREVRAAPDFGIAGPYAVFMDGLHSLRSSGKGPPSDLEQFNAFRGEGA